MTQIRIWKCQWQLLWKVGFLIKTLTTLGHAFFTSRYSVRLGIVLRFAYNPGIKVS